VLVWLGMALEGSGLPWSPSFSLGHTLLFCIFRGQADCPNLGIGLETWNDNDDNDHHCYGWPCVDVGGVARDFFGQGYRSSQDVLH
jgi:hypothetical protein